MILLILLVGLIPATVMSQVFLILYKNRSVESDVTDMTSHLQQMNHQVVTSGYLDGNASVQVEDQLSALAQSYSGRIMLVNSALKIVKDTYDVDEGKTIVWSNVVKTMKGSITSFYDEQNSNLIVSVPIVSQTQESGGKVTGKVVGAFVATQSMDYIEQNLAYFRSVQIIGLLLIYIVVITAAVLYSKRFVAPWRKLSRSVANVTEGVEEKLAPAEDYTEVQEMTDHLSAFMEKMTIMCLLKMLWCYIMQHHKI